jgi:hypothetical protein
MLSKKQRSREKVCLSVFSNFGADRHARDYGLEEELGGGQGKDQKVEGIKAFQAILASAYLLSLSNRGGYLDVRPWTEYQPNINCDRIFGFDFSFNANIFLPKALLQTTHHANRCL